MKDYIVLAFKNLRRRKLRSWLTIIGILIGISSVVVLMVMGDSLQKAVISQFDVSSTELLTVRAKGLTGGGLSGAGVIKPLTKEDVEAIERLGSVEKAFARNVEQVKIEYKDEVNFGYAISIPEKDRELVYKIIGAEADMGHLLKEGESGRVFLGHNYYDKIFKNEIRPGKKIIIQGKKFEVVGIMKKKGSFLFDNAVAMGDKDLKELMGYGDEVDIIGVKVKDKDLVNKAKEEIEKLMRKRRDVKKGEEDFEVETPQAILKKVNSILGGIKAFLIIIASISIVIGAIGIINTMTTSVLERTKEIGTMKAVGARNSDIFKIFLFESGFLTGVLAINKFIGITAKPSINLFLVLFLVVESFIIGSAAGIVPALNAANQNPVEALRK